MEQKLRKEAEPAAVQLARGVMDSMLKLSKLQRLYSPNNEIIKKQTAAFFENVGKFFEENERLDLRITPTEVIFMGRPVYENTDRQQSFAFRMFKDGIRRLCILRGVTVEELMKLLSILGTEFRSEAATYEDLSTLMWKADFKNITYSCVRRFREIRRQTDGADRDPTAMSREDFYLRQILSRSIIPNKGADGSVALFRGGEGSPWDGVAYVRSLVGGEGGVGLPLGSSDATSAGAAAMGGRGGGGVAGESSVAGKEEEGAAVSAESIRKFLQALDAIDSEEGQESVVLEKNRGFVEEETSQQAQRYTLFALGKDLVFLLEKGPASDAVANLGHLIGLLHMILAGGDATLYFAIIDRLYLLLDPASKVDQEVKRLVADTLRAEVKGEGLVRLIAGISVNEPAQVEKLVSFVSAFGGSLSEELVAMIETVEDDESLTKIEDILFRVNRGSLDFFKDKLYDRRVAVVKSMLKCLARSGNEEAIALMARAARHPNPEVRVFLLKLMKVRAGPHYKQVLLEAAWDRSEDVRLEAVRQIFFLKDPFFKKRLMERVESKEFPTLPQVEKVAVCKALATISGKEVEPLFIKWLEKKALLRKDEVDGLKIAAAEGLGVIGGATAREALFKASGSSNPQLREVCERLLRSMR